MLVCSRALPGFVLLAVLPALPSASCSKRMLDVGGGQLDPGAGGTTGAGAGTAGASAGAGGVTGTGGQAGPIDGGPTPPDATVIIPDAGEAGCVRASILLPWRGWASGSNNVGRLDVVTAGDAIAVTNRQDKQLDVRTYLADGTVVGGFQFGADTQFRAYRDGNFLLITRATTGDFTATALQPNLVDGTRLATATAVVTEHMLAGIALASDVVLITDEHFVNITTGRYLTWFGVLGNADLFKTGRLHGIAGQGDRLLLATETGRNLRVDVIDASGAPVYASLNQDFFGDQGTAEVNAIPFGTGLLMFDGNPVRLTQIGFNLALKVLGHNSQLLTFSGVRPRVAAIALAGRLVGFWLTIFPQTDTSNLDVPHDLYGCEIDPAAPATCLRTAPIWRAALDGPDAVDPVAAAALPAGDAFAVAHTDNAGNTWLTIADLDCASPRP